MEINIHAKKTNGTQNTGAEVKIVTTTYENFKVLKLVGTDQNGNDIKVNVYLDVQQSVKKVTEYAFSHPKYKKTA